MVGERIGRAFAAAVVVSIGACALLAGGRLATDAEPAPQLPDWLVDELLADLAAIDVERWRRFQGKVTRTFQVDDQSWQVALGRGEPYEPGDMRAWWRGGDGDVIPELVGTLSIEEREPFRVLVELLRTRSGVVQSTLVVSGRGLWASREKYEREAPAPPPEGVPGAPAPDLQAWARFEGGSGWTGLPAPLTEVREELPLDTLLGTWLFIGSLSDLHVGDNAEQAPDVGLFEAQLGDEQSAPTVVVRLTADGPIAFEVPDLPNGRWNQADALDLDYCVERISLADNALTVSGDEWLFTVTGANLRCRVERV